MGLDTEATIDPYVLCARATIDDLYAFAQREGFGRDILTVFEKGDPEGLLRKHLHKHGFPDPQFAWAREFRKKGRLQPTFLGLQAAGWLVWEYYVDFCRIFGLSEHPPTDLGREALRAFEQMPGDIRIPHLRNPLEDVLRQSDKAFRKSLQVTNDASRTLEKIVEDHKTGG
jgi:hypothetical protein